MRRKTNAEDRELLYSIYSRIKNPDSATRRDIAKTLGWPERSVRIWFQNMRQKDASRMKAGLVTTSPIPDQDAFNVVNEVTARQAQTKCQEEPLDPSMMLIPSPIQLPSPAYFLPDFTAWNQFPFMSFSTPFYVSPRDLHPFSSSNECDTMMNAFFNPSSFLCPDTSTSTKT